MPSNTLPNFLGMLWKTPSEKEWDKHYVAMTRRPRKEEMGVAGVDTFQEWQLPPHPIAFRDMYNLAKLQVNIRTSIKHLVWELVRRGLEWKENWTAKCTGCGAKYHSISSYLPCPECGGDMVSPDPTEYQWADGKIKNCNLNHQSLLQVIETMSEDHHTVDEGYMVLRKEYIFDEKGNIAKGRVHEIIRASPILMRPVSNPKTGRLGWNLMVCPQHRGKVITMTEDQGSPDYSVDNYFITTKKCKHPGCSKTLYPIHYITLKNEGGEPEDYFIEGEVINRHLYGTNLLYGTPPMITLWPIAAALFYQETYIRDAFERKRIPNGALLVNTSNSTGFLKFWKEIVLELKNDPHFVPVIPLETEPGATQQGRVNFVKFMDSLKEMEYIPTRDEFRQRIASFYGVSTMFMADTRSAGQGSLSEGSQLIVSSRSIERIQKVWNEHYLPRLSQALGVHNWTLQIKPTEDRDLLKDLQKEQLQLQVNQMYTTIGYKSEKDPYNGEWLHKKDFNQELATTMQTMQTLLQLTGGGMGMGMGAGGDGSGGGEMQSYEPNPKATEKAFGEVEPQEGGELIKSKSPGTPSQGTTNMSAPMKMDKKTQSGGGGTPASVRTKDAPGMPHNYSCKYCGEQFSDKRALGGHMKARHPGGGGGGGNEEDGENMEGALMPDPASMRNVLILMRNSQMFDQNIMAVLEATLGGEYPTEEKAPKGGGGKRATQAGFQRQRKYS